MVGDAVDIEVGGANQVQDLWVGNFTCDIEAGEYIEKTALLQ